MNTLIHKWVEIGNQNPWVSRAIDPPLSERSFTECHTVQELWDKLSYGNWCLAEAFFIDNICFMNQSSSGWGEWLAIRDEIAFESISFNPERTPVEWWEEFIKDVKRSSEEQLKTLKYRRRDEP